MNTQEILGYIFVSFDALVGLTIILIVLLQGGKIRGIGSAITGTSDSALFEQEKRNRSEKFSSKLTWFLCATFFILTLLIIIFIHHDIITFR